MKKSKFTFLVGAALNNKLQQARTILELKKPSGWSAFNQIEQEGYHRPQTQQPSRKDKNYNKNQSRKVRCRIWRR